MAAFAFSLAATASTPAPTPTPTGISFGRDEVFVAAVPLRATPLPPANFLISTAYSLDFWNFQHFMVIIKPSSPPPRSQHQALVYDFQPEDPQNIWVAVAALSGRKVPGVILVRKLKKLPTRKCWFVGYSKANAIDAALKFNENWATDLRIGHHDCRDYSQGLVEYLTGEKDVLERLKEAI
ncbi:uncharacterized protein LOC105178761 [Sesamum indicum]|uniref:Uncharacterized protein LOC105178761 n=1 Tax=Sesamum indicum TaxID=4182 RepID=A0A6I9UZI7_SESIN|nr:uncharacterized protein LOC105178761 [Sesamum indicum]